MFGRQVMHIAARTATVAVIALSAMGACTKQGRTMGAAERIEFGARYAKAWSSQQASSVAAFYEEQGSLSINGKVAAGRAAITADAQGFMTAFPDMVVSMDSLVVKGAGTEFHWMLTGTNSGPGGTGKAVRIHGFEEWAFGPDKLIATSLGHFDSAEYSRQVKEGYVDPATAKGTK